ncbi:MAG: selenocysteine-specific translation elongation factor [Firmicutes bacterium]|nr:selenocysteine-specific translation elongation factor [Bacillota bacterium]
MKHFILGTAGHIDHGKTSLVRALTGRDTDRLQEEHKRGITIELGFTYYDDPSGVRVGIVDVPGHEKFVKNMLSGVHGMDLVMMVIAADEGIMPQTIEHINILSLIGVKRGIVVITKIDMVDKDWLELVVSDIKDQLADTFLENSTILMVSSKTGEGIDELKNYISDEIEKADYTESNDPGILPVDRVFTLKGVGTVVTGTQIEGVFKTGDDIEIFPYGILSKIKSIQVHGEDASESHSSQRVALNLTKVKKEDFDRGAVISTPSHLLVSNLIDVKLKVLKDSNFSIKNKSRVRFHVASKETFARVNLLDRDELLPGEECYCQLKLEENIVARRKDKFIVRFFSPIITIGGGEIIEINPNRKKRFREDALALIELKDNDDLSKAIIGLLKEHHGEMNIDKLSKSLNKDINALESYIEELEDNAILVRINDILVLRELIDRLTNDITNYLKAYHKENPLRLGVPVEEIRSKFLNNISTKEQDPLLTLIVNEGEIDFNGDYLKLSSYIREYSVEQLKKIEEIKKLLSSEFRTFKKSELDSDGELVSALISDKLLIDIGGELMLYDTFLKAQDILLGAFKEKDTINAKDYRDLLNTNRKTAVGLLEYFDAKKITKRVGDERTLIRRS